MFELNPQIGLQIKEKQEEYSSYKRKVDWFGVKSNGEHKLRVLPPFSSRGDFGKVVSLFFQMPGKDGSNKNRHVCVEKTYPELGLRCPIMDVLRELDSLSEGGKKFNFVFKDFLPSSRLFTNVLVRETTNAIKTDPNRVYLAEFTGSLNYWLWEKIMDKDYGNIVDPYTGRDIKITRKEEGKVSYNYDVLPNQTPILPTQELVDSVLSQLYDIDDYWSPPNEEIMKIIKESATIYRNNLLMKYQLVGNTFQNVFNNHNPNPYDVPRVQPQVGTGVFGNPQQQTFNSSPNDFSQYQQPIQQPVQQVQQVQQPVQQVQQPVQQVQQPVQQPIQQPIQQPVQQVQQPIQQPIQQPVQQVQQPIQQPIQQPVQQVPSETTTTFTVAKPPSAPDCFGDVLFYNQGKNPTCQKCVFEFECLSNQQTK